MYQAKRHGGGHYVFDERDDEAASRRLDIEGWLRHASSDGTLTAQYQPIVSLPSGELTGFEALARGAHPVLGPAPPGQACDRLASGRLGRSAGTIALTGCGAVHT